jgi:hypothetical protein
LGQLRGHFALRLRLAISSWSPAATRRSRLLGPRPAAFTGQVFHRLAAQVTDAQLENAQIEIARAAVRHFALSADVLAFDTATLNHSQIER